MSRAAPAIILSGTARAAELLVPRIVGLLTMARNGRADEAIVLLKDARRDCQTLTALVDLTLRELEADAAGAPVRKA